MCVGTCGILTWQFAAKQLCMLASSLEENKKKHRLSSRATMKTCTNAPFTILQQNGKKTSWVPPVLMKGKTKKK